MNTATKLCGTVVLGILLTTGAWLDAAAQATASGTASVLSTGLTISQRADLNFGQILPDGTEQTRNVDPAASSDAASFLLAGSDDASVVISHNTADLSDGSGNSVPYTVQVVGNSQDVQSGAVGLSNPVTLSSTGEYFVWVGGTITIAPDQTPGSYETTITVNASYY